MKEENIGIIIQKKEKKILFYNDSCYIKVRVHEDDDINKIIASKIKSLVDMNRFNIIKTYIYKPYSKLVELNIVSDKEITMYLVEVCIYHTEYEFVKIEDLLDIISDHSEREFFKQNFVDYMLYKNSSQSFIFNNILILLNLLLYCGDSIKLSENILLSILILIVCGYYLIGKCIVPKFINYLVKFKVSVKTMNNLNYISFILLVYMLIKTYLLYMF